MDCLFCYLYPHNVARTFGNLQLDHLNWFENIYLFIVREFVPFFFVQRSATRTEREMYVYVCTCVYAYVYVCTCVYTYMYVCMYLWVCMNVCVCMYLWVCMYVCVYVCMCICMYVYMYVYMYVCVYVCMCIWVYVCVCRESFYSSFFAAVDSVCQCRTNKSTFLSGKVTRPRRRTRVQSRGGFRVG